MLVIADICLSEAQPPATQIRQDILTIVSDSSSPGLEYHQATIQRVHNHPGAYLDEFTEMYIGRNYRLTDHVEFHIPQFLAIANQSDSEQIKERVGYLAEMLIAHYSNVLQMIENETAQNSRSPELSDDSQKYYNHLKAQRANLEFLLGQITEESTDFSN